MVRHHEMPRQDLFTPSCIAEDSALFLDDLMSTRKTVLLFPDGKSVTKVDDLTKAESPDADVSGYWRGTTTFCVKHMNKFY